VSYTQNEDSGFTCCNKEKAYVRQGRLGREKIMSRFTKLALLTLAAILVLGFSISVNAGRPDGLQTLTSAPLWGDGGVCTVANLSDRDIEVTWEIWLPDGTQVALAGNATETVEAYKQSANGGSTFGTSTYCRVTWQGTPDDLRASYCTERDTVIYRQNCLEMH
jgi:hypothetical protein